MTLLAPITTLRLSRTLDPGDFAQLGPELVVVDRHGPPPPRPQRWSYALALHAITRWRETTGAQLGAGGIYDIGDAEDSPFEAMLIDWLQRDAIDIIDPRDSREVALERWIRQYPTLADVVTCLGALAYVRDLDKFCYYLSCLLRPGGLLVLTMDFSSRCGLGATEAAGRERIFCRQSYRALRVRFAEFQLQPFGGLDVTYHGPHVGTHTVASLVLEKRR